MRRYCALLLCILLLAGCHGPGANAYDRANHAFKRGEFKQSFADYLYAANQDVVPAQYCLAYQYFYGLGTPIDQQSAVQWLTKAAHHSERARYALYLIDQHAPHNPWAYKLQLPKYQTNAP